jgi:lipid-A-disaccharide synthase
LIAAASAPLLALLQERFEALVPGCRVILGRTYDCLAASQAAVIASGTATLEAALLKTPFVAVYRLSALSYLAGRLLVRIPYVTLPNILLQEPVVTELLQGDCRPDLICEQIVRLLDQPEAALRQRQKFDIMKKLLGPGGAQQRAAAAILEEIGL